MSPAELLARFREPFEWSNEPDWSLARPDFEVHDHELLDSAVHRGRAGWKRWVSDWQQAFEDYRLEELDTSELDDRRVLTVHRLRARGRSSGVTLDRVDAQLWTFENDRLVRMDYYPNYDVDTGSWSSPGR